MKLLEPTLVDKLDEIMAGKPGWQTGLMTVTDAGWPVSRPLPPPPPPAPPPAPPEPTAKSVLFVLDCSGSMDNVAGQNLDLEGGDDEFTRQLKAAGAKTGAITCSLKWEKRLDLDLHCTTPGGQHIFFSDKKPKGSGGELDVDMTTGGVENIYFEKPQYGHYRFWVHDYSKKSRASSPTRFTIRLVRDGQVVEERTINHVGSDVTVWDFDYDETTRLSSCKQALLDIYRDNISPDDQVSLITFASDVRVDLGWTKKAGSEHHVPPLFKSLETRGQTAMFSAVARAVKLTQEVSGMPGYQNWIVLLCDGDDNESAGLDGSDCGSVVKQLEAATADGSLKGLIAIAAGSGVSGDAIRPLPNATAGGMMIETSDAGIGEAFGKAASQIESVGQAEAVSGAVGTDVVEAAAAVSETL